jgi:uncharacterized protein
LRFPDGTLRDIGQYVVLGLACALTSLIPAALHLPSPTLFAGLLVGIARGLTARRQVLVPERAATAAQGVVGAVQGAYVTLPAIVTIGRHAPVVVLACLLTLAATVVAGRLLALTAHLDLPTAAFGMIAGGAQGIIAISDKLGADSRMVAMMQYMRLLLIVLTTPLVATLAFHAHGGGSVAAAPAVDWPTGTVFVVVSIAAGLLFARLTRLPSGALLGPMLISAVLVITGVPFAVGVPAGIEYVAYAVIGLEVGVRFTPQAISQAGRLFPLSLGFTVGLLAICAALGLGLARLSGVSALAGYLATTPGGLYSVLAIASNTGSSATFVLSVQVIRLFMMLLAAPPLARWLTTSNKGDNDGDMG